MQMKRRHFFRSYPMRLTITIVLVVASVLGIGAFINHRTAINSVFNESVEKVQSSVTNTILHIENVLNSVEVVVSNLSWVLLEEQDDPDAMYRITRQIVKNNDFVYGSSIAFEPSYYKEKGLFYAPYSYRKGDEICCKQLGSEDYDYHYMDWYQIPKLLGKPYWSEPYYDMGGGDMIMTTYSLPVYDDKDNLIAVLTADISLEWFAEQINSIKLYPNSYNMLVGRGGAFLMHHDRNAILNETIFSQALADDDQILLRLGHDIISGEQGLSPLTYNGLDWAVFYAPIKATGWSVIVACMDSEIFAEFLKVNRISGILVLAMLLLMSVMSFISIRAMTRPLVEFADSANDIAHGNFDAKLPAIKSKDEMRILHDSFVYMQDSLASYVEELKETTANNARIDSELRIARVIQMDLVPKVFPPYPERNDIDIYARVIPAKEVGGDLYDFLLNDDKLYFILGDVSGKGVPAALVMAIICRLFHTVATTSDGASGIVRTLNDSISETNELNMFCTAFVGILDLKTGHLQYCNAGHNPAIVKELNGETHCLDVIPNIPMGVWNGFDYKVQECYLAKGDMLVIYTDGITEAMSADGLMYSDDRLVGYLSDNLFTDSQALVDSVVSDVKRYVGGTDQSDDITLMCVRVDPDLCGDLSMQLVLNNRIEDIDRMTEFVEELCDRKNVGAEARFNIRLALEEAVTNVIMYAFPKEESHSFNLSVREQNGCLVFQITDSGKEFDPTSAPEPDITLSAEERPIGGLGIFLIRRVMDKVQYDRIDGKNVLTLVKNLKTD